MTEIECGQLSSCSDSDDNSSCAAEDMGDSCGCGSSMGGATTPHHEQVVAGSNPAATAASAAIGSPSAAAEGGAASIEDGDAENDVDELNDDNDVFNQQQPSLLSDFDSLTEPSLESLTSLAKTPLPPPPPSTTHHVPSVHQQVFGSGHVSTTAGTAAAAAASMCSNASTISALEDEMLLLRLMDLRGGAAAAAALGAASSAAASGSAAAAAVPSTSHGSSSVATRAFGRSDGGSGAHPPSSSRNHFPSRPVDSRPPTASSSGSGSSLAHHPLIDSLQLDLGSAGLSRMLQQRHKSKATPGIAPLPSLATVEKIPSHSGRTKLSLNANAAAGKSQAGVVGGGGANEPNETAKKPFMSQHHLRLQDAVNNSQKQSESQIMFGANSGPISVVDPGMLEDAAAALPKPSISGPRGIIQDSSPGLDLGDVPLTGLSPVVTNMSNSELTSCVNGPLPTATPLPTLVQANSSSKEESSPRQLRAAGRSSKQQEHSQETDKKSQK